MNDEWLESTDYLNFEFLEIEQQKEEVMNYLRSKLKELIHAQLVMVDVDVEQAVKHQIMLAAASNDMRTVYVLNDLLITLYSLEK